MIASAGSRSSSRVPVLNKYEVLEELGHGGMATVYRAHDKRLARDVAIKVLHPHLRESSEIAHRFGVEAKAVAKLRHPNIVEVFDVSSDDDGEQFLVVELVRGPTLRKILQKHAALPPEIGAAIVMELLSGIAHAHAAGVIHRDVKPENVLIEHRPVNGAADSAPAGAREPNEKGHRVAVKLTDFGIAKLLDAQGVTSTGQVLGSPAHMAPEQIEGGDVDGRADVFGLGVLLYECVVGHLPFLGNNPAQVLRRVLDGVYQSAERERPVVGRRWSEIIDKALARNPAERYPDAAAMREAVAAELTRLGMGTPRTEIEAWLDDPEGWTKTHDESLIDRLCKLGAQERKRSDAVGAAADYNRALAYAPADPALLKLVASMQRAEARARMIRRVAPLVLGAAVLVPGTYFAVKSLRTVPPKPELAHPIATSSAPTASVSAAKLAPTAPTSSVAVVTPPPPNPSQRVIASPVVSAPKPVTRTITFTTVQPPFGVHMAIDGAPGPDPIRLGNFTLADDKQHTLVFTCEKELCAPKTMIVAAGEGNQDLDVTLNVPPAKLVVDGEATHTYGITELPGQVIANGEEVYVPIVSGGQRTVHVYDRNGDSRGQEVTLNTGRRTSVAFKH